MKKSRFIIQPVGVKDDTSSIVVNDVGSDTVTSSSASPHNMATPDATLHQQPQSRTSRMASLDEK